MADRIYELRQMPSAREFPIGTLRTRILEDHSLPITEGGVFETPVMGEPNFNLLFGMSLREYVNHRIGIALANAVVETQVPIEFWHIDLDPTIQTALSLPTNLNFGVH